MLLKNRYNYTMSEKSYDIYKAAGIIIRDRQVLATRSKGSDIYIQPGGKLEEGETEQQAVVRELKEELGIDVDKSDLEKLGDYYAEAAGKKGQWLKLAAFHVVKFSGEPRPMSEVVEIRGFTSQIPADVIMASIFEHDIIPDLKSRNLID